MPETAFVVGGRIEAEYEVFRFLGLRPEVQGLQTIRGCHFEVSTARDAETGQAQRVYFKLGRDALDLEARPERQVTRWTKSLSRPETCYR